jgi:hypothetical protein
MAYFFPLPIVTKGQGEEMSFHQKEPPRGQQTHHYQIESIHRFVILSGAKDLG